MATQTSNLGLTKPGYDEAADVVPAVNNNMDTLDEKIGAVPANTSVQAQITANAQAIAKLDESIAIVSNGNTHAAIAAGQYVYIKGHGTLAEGLYTANSAISANATLSNSNVTAVSGGGLNALNSNITALSNKTRYYITDIVTPPYNHNYTLYKVGRIVVMDFDGLFISSAQQNTWVDIATIPSSLLPEINIAWTSILSDAINGNEVAIARCAINKTTGKISIKSNTAVNAAAGASGSVSWTV